MQGCPRARLGRRTAKKLLQLGQCPVLTWPGSWARREAVSRVCMDREGQKGFLTPLRFQFIPESARYNISKGNVAAALATLQRIAEMNRAVMPEGVLKEPAKVNQTPPSQAGLRHQGVGEGVGPPSISRSASFPLLTWFFSKQLLSVITKMSFFFWRDSNLGHQKETEFSAFFFFIPCVRSEKYHAEKRSASSITKKAPCKARSSLLPIHPPGASPVP